jgi:Flp pilus assembly protein TadD
MSLRAPLLLAAAVIALVAPTHGETASGRPLIAAPARAERTPFGFGARDGAKPEEPRRGRRSHDKGEAEAPAKPATPAQRAAVAQQDRLSQIAFWDRELLIAPNDLEAAQKLSELQRLEGQNDRAAITAMTGLAAHADDRALLLSAGRAFLALSRGARAAPLFLRLTQLDPQDWRAFSLAGVAHDYMGDPEGARRLYGQALALQPNEPSVLANLALSHVLTGDPAQAEAILRGAALQPGAGAQVRQNLALVLGLQGKFEEAEQIARQDMPANFAAGNIGYLRDMVAGARRWESATTSQR